jgi:biopolymer transport protein ExbD
MPKVIRLILVPLTAIAVTAGSWAAENAPRTTHPVAEYKRADANFYPKSEFLKADPTAVIIPKSNYTQNGDSYFFTPKIRAPKAIYVEALNDWIEPITPPDGPVAMPPDAIQIREPQGDVQAALPSAPANFSPVTDGMTLPNGAVVKTGANGTAAVRFGGVDSARLMPNSAAAVQQTVTAQSRSAEVDLTIGGVFSKVGTQVGVQGSYEVHTPFGNSRAQGGDFVTITTSAGTDVWIAQGTVYLEHPEIAETMTIDGAGPLKIIHFPQISDPHLAMMADAETLTAILNFIPLANQKIKALRDRIANGGTLTANEQAYLNRIKQVPSLIKLALVTPPKPAPTLATPEPASTLAMPSSTPTPPPAPAPAAASAPISVPTPPAPADLKPIRAVVRVDGKVNFQGATYELPGFKSKLEAVMQATPDQAILLKAGKTVPYDKFKTVLDICQSVPVKNLTVLAPPQAPEPAAAESPAPNLPTPGLLMHPSMEPMPGPAPPEAPSAPPTTNAPPPAAP